MVGAFGRKPSDSHVVWTSGGPRDERGTKRFDFEYLELWAAQFGIDYESRTRVDHERADEPREQHACIFEWAKSDGQTIELDGEQWTMGEKRTPRTFVEIDDAGVARLKGWQKEMTFDVLECWLDGTAMLFKTSDQGNKKVDGRKLLSKEKRKRLI